ncbi:hypothetical protein FRUB_10342 [Fimbriiglobus ruber]|uniref:Uncharacterized protein n=2 Tax=Fimbriiglobus ruber TaxID=1908690 RepID=A0A225CYF6_9BACT|nr:hypothetical protein FRUB_10342 [Fimbriiglobus ruber]
MAQLHAGLVPGATKPSRYYLIPFASIEAYKRKFAAGEPLVAEPKAEEKPIGGCLVCPHCAKAFAVTASGV